METEGDVRQIASVGVWQQHPSCPRKQQDKEPLQWRGGRLECTCTGLQEEEEEEGEEEEEVPGVVGTYADLREQRFELKYVREY